MSIAQLVRYVPATCCSCKVMSPDCMVPIGDNDTRPMCWLCAHLVTAHDHPVGTPVVECGCTRDEIYPPEVLARRQRMSPSAEIALGAALDAAPQEDRSQVPEPENVRHGRATRSYALSAAHLRARDERRERCAAVPEPIAVRAIMSLRS